MEAITDEIPSSVMSFIVSVLPIGNSFSEINTTLVANDDNVYGGMHHHIFNSVAEMTALYYSILVFAKNILIEGYSEKRLCNYLPICKSIVFSLHFSHVLLYF